MSPILIIITALACFYVAWGFVEPSRLYRFDCAVSLMFLAWLIPQMIIIEQTEFRLYFDFSFTWGYVFACQLGAYVGFFYGNRASSLKFKNYESIYSFDIRKANRAAIILISIGFLGFFLMAREANDLGISGEWSGVITFYYLIGQFILFGGSLAWLLFLHEKKKVSLIIFVSMIIVALPVVLFFARRGILFQVGFAVFSGAYLVSRYLPPRISVMIGIILGVLVLNSAGNIRAHIERENGTLISSVTSGDAFNTVNIYEDNPASEVKSALTDIEIARNSRNFQPLVALWNTFVLQYTPAFIFGRDFKEGLMIERQADTVIERFSMVGSTRTGFAEAYTGYWYFGILIFLGIGVYQGKMWGAAKSGDIRSQYYYVIVMNYSLLTVTESISRFFVTLPIIYGIGFLVFRYAKLGQQTTSQSLPNRATANDGVSV